MALLARLRSALVRALLGLQVSLLLHSLENQVDSGEQTLRFIVSVIATSVELYMLRH